MLALPFFVLLLAVFEIAIVFLAQHELETAVEKTSRNLLTGNTQQSANLTAANFTQSICQELPVFFTCSQIMVDLQQAAAFSSANTSTPTFTYDSNGNVTNAWQFSPGAGGSIMVLRVMYQFPLLPSVLSFNLANLPNGKHLIMASSVFEAEDF